MFLSIGNAAYTDYIELLSIRRKSDKTFADYEDRCSAALAILNPHGDSVFIPETLAAWSLKHNVNVDPPQQLEVIYAAVSSAVSFKPLRSPGKNNFLSAIRYEPVTAVVRQCGNQILSAASKPLDSLSSNASSANTLTTRSLKRFNKKRLNSREFAHLKGINAGAARSYVLVLQCTTLIGLFLQLSGLLLSTAVTIITQEKRVGRKHSNLKRATFLEY